MKKTHMVRIQMQIELTYDAICQLLESYYNSNEDYNIWGKKGIDKLGKGKGRR